MKYCIMCGGTTSWNYPRQLTKIYGETLVERTIRLLKEAGVAERDIFVSATENNISAFRELGLDVSVKLNQCRLNGWWVECFFPINEPCVYLCGDVVFSPEAIKTIVFTETADIEFFASAPPFAKNYSKPWAEPFGFKVVDMAHLRFAQFETALLAQEGKFNRRPGAWEFWQVVKGTPINEIDYTNYTVINDYTCDIDDKDDIQKFEGAE